MRKFLFTCILWISLSASLSSSKAYAQEEEIESSPPVQQQEPLQEESTSPESRPAPRKATNRAREKEAEGTQARNRFEEDPVIKSRYQLGGESLEVDPD